jgi:hypothetical protein
VPGGQGFLRSVDEAEVDDLNVGPAEALRDSCEVTFEARFEPRKLRPIRVETDAEDTDLEGTPTGVRHLLISLGISTHGRGEQTTIITAPVRQRKGSGSSLQVF